MPAHEEWADTAERLGVGKQRTDVCAAPLRLAWVCGVHSIRGQRGTLIVPYAHLAPMHESMTPSLRISEMTMLPGEAALAAGFASTACVPMSVP